MAKQKFRGVQFTLKEKCYSCEHLERRCNGNSSLTSNGILIDCEGFYYIFKKLEEFEKLDLISIISVVNVPST